MCPERFLKIAPKSNNYQFSYLTSSNFVTISHMIFWDQVNSWKNLWKFLNGPLYRNKSDLFSLLNVEAYWESSNTEVCTKELSQILANDIDGGRRGLGEFMWGIVLYRLCGICKIQWWCSRFLFQTLFCKFCPKN